MRILAGIPTYHRQTAPALATQLAKFVDRVVIVPQDTELPVSKEYEIAPVERGLRNARNMVFHLAREGDYDAVIHCDDDVKMSDEYLRIFLLGGKYLLEKGVSSFCGKSRLMAFWDGAGYSNKLWEVRPRMNQLSMLSMKAVDIVGDATATDIGEGLFEDLDYTLRMIKQGLVPTQFAKPKMTYNHSVTRHDKADGAGGYSGEEFLSWIPRSIQRMNMVHGDVVTITETKPGKHRVTFNWDEIRKYIPDLGLGYLDKKGIRC